MAIDPASRRYYERNAQAYTDHVRDPHASPFHSLYEKPAMYALTPPLRGLRVLSVGCGSGEDSEHLRKMGAKESVGIDLSEALIHEATEAYPLCEFQVMDMEAITFPSASFDFVYSSLALHYSDDIEKVFMGISRVLRPCASFLFSVGHPTRFSLEEIEDSKIRKVRRLEIKKDRETHTEMVTGDCLSIRKILNALGPHTATIYSYPLGEIAKRSFEAGFLIERIVEPRPLPTLSKKDPQLYARLSKIPEFIIFKLMKRRND